jgi:hypothetical protein
VAVEDRDRERLRGRRELACSAGLLGAAAV